MKKKNWGLNYKSTIFIYIMIIISIPVIVLGIVSYRTYVNGVSDKVEVSTEATVSQVKSRVDTALSNIRSSYVNEIDQDELKWLINADIWYSNYTKLERASKILGGPSYYLSYISGYTFINFDTQWVLSNRGMFKLSEVKNQEQVNELFHLYDGTHIYWVDHTQMEEEKLSREEIKVGGLNLVLKAPLIKKNPNCLLIVNINQSYLKQVLQEDLAGGDITVLNGEGNPVFYTNKDVASYCRQNYEGLKDQKQIRLEEGQEYSLASADSGVLDWTYLVSYDMEVIRSDGGMILSLMLILLVVIVVTVLALLMSRRIYQPVLQLIKRVNGLSPEERKNGGRKQKENEFDYISGKIDSLVNNRDFFESLVASQQPQLLELFQIRMLHGNIKKEQLGTYLEKLKIHVQKYYMVMAVIIKYQETQELYDETKQDALQINVIENMPGEIKKLLFLPPIYYERVLALAVTADEEETLDKKVTDICERMDSFVSEQYDFHLSIGVSLQHRELTGFRDGYHESLEAMKNNEFMGTHEEASENTVLLFYSDIKENHIRYAYDRLSERELKEAIDSNNTGTAFHILDRFIDTLIENNVQQSDCYLHLHRLAIAGMLVATDAGIQLNQVFGKDMGNNVFLMINQIYDMEKMRCFLKYKVIEPIIHTVNELRTGKSAETMKDIERLIEESDGNITLAECAEKLNYHPSYIWKVTRMKSNTTFTDFVGNYKIEKAKNLLLNTNMTISEIAAALNYTNSQNFIRFFSKLEGITPGKYRQINKK